MTNFEVYLDISKKVRYSPVTVEFKCKETINEIYRIHLTELKDTITVLDDDDKQGLRDAYAELSNLLAIVKLKEARNHIRQSGNSIA